MPLDVFVLLAVVLGILYTMRKLDVQRRVPEQFPHVARADFERWKAREVFAYNLASFACVVKIVIDFALYLARSRLDWSVVRLIGASTFFAWFAALIVSLVLGSAARKLRDELRIDLSRPHEQER